MAELRRRMMQDLQLRRLSERTQEAYLRAVKKLTEYSRTLPVQPCEEQVQEYLLFLKNDCGFAPGSMRVAVNGIKFFYRYTALSENAGTESGTLHNQRGELHADLAEVTAAWAFLDHSTRRCGLAIIRSAAKE